MEAVSRTDILGFIKQNTAIPGVGNKTWEDLIPNDLPVGQGSMGVLLDQIWEVAEELGADPAIVEVLSRMEDGLGLGGPGETVFPAESAMVIIEIEQTDGIIHPDGGGPSADSGPGGPIVNPQPANTTPGPKKFTQQRATIRTKRWKATAGGRVQFVLLEGPSANGPWNVERCQFTLAPGQQAPNLVLKPGGGQAESWWMLVVTALSVASKFSAPPFVL